MEMIRKARQERKLPQRRLAARSGISFRCLQQLESDGHNGRMESLKRVAAGLGLPERGLEFELNRFFSLAPDSVAEISLRMHLDGFASWPVHLFNFVDRFRSTQQRELVVRPPVQELDDRLKALTASTVEALCLEMNVVSPAWCRATATLMEPWFVSGMENLKAMALVESPVFFRMRNIFVLENFLRRA